MRLIDADKLKQAIPETKVDVFENCGNCTCLTDEQVKELIDEAPTIEALKEQEAKQIIRKQCKKEHDDGAVTYFAEWYCPHCKLLILRGFSNPSIKFCYQCGKPILWESR